MTQSIQDINHSIMFGNFTNDQLNSIVMAVKYARGQLVQRNKSQIRLGQMVKFNSTKHGQILVGDVTKIAVKYVTVRTPVGQWRVPANMLEAA